MRRNRKVRRRAGFTIVELLVAMALIIFIMYVLAEAFGAGVTAFRNLKAIGDMNERLRTTSTILRRYLQADHFEGRRRLSDPGFWTDNNGPPEMGFIRIWQNSPPANVATAPTSPYLFEGKDADDVDSFRASDHGLHFAVRLRGNNRGDFFRTMVPDTSVNSALMDVNPTSGYTGALPRLLLDLPNPGGRFQDPPTGAPTSAFTSPWAEIALFLKDTGQDTGTENATVLQANPSLSPLKLYTLHLRQRLLVPADEDVHPKKLPPNATTQWTFKIKAGNAANYLEVSNIDPDPLDPPSPPNPGKIYFNSPADVTMPIRRFGSNNGTLTPGPTAPSTTPGTPYLRLLDENPSQAGNDVLLTDVLSFEVRVMLAPECNFVLDYTPTISDPTAKPLKVPLSQSFVNLNDPRVTKYMVDYSNVPTVPPTGTGSGYKKDEFLTVQGGTYSNPAVLKVVDVSPTGAITKARYVRPGWYGVHPSNPVNVTGGSGSGATFNLQARNPNLSPMRPDAGGISYTNPLPGVYPVYVDKFRAPPPTDTGPVFLYPGATQSLVFDTWSQRKDSSFNYSGWSNAYNADSIPTWEFANEDLPIRQRIRIVALQINVRIWDSKTQQSRQTSMVVDL